MSQLVITCMRCGYSAPQGTPTCPRCGDALAPTASAGTPSAPPWMRSLQGGPAPVMPQAGGPPGGPDGAWGEPEAVPPPGSLAVSSLVSDDALPDWMREAGAAPQQASSGFGGGPPTGWGGPAGAPQGGAAWNQPAMPAMGAPAFGGGPPANQPNGMPGYGGAGGTMPSAALFDEGALPDWLRTAETYQPPAQPPAGPPTGWGQAMPPQQQGPQYPAFGGMMAPPPAPYGNMPAQSLLDTSALPTWLGGSGQAPMAMQPNAPLGGSGISASSLVDERSLPLWMREPPAAPTVQSPPEGSVSQWLAAPVVDEPLPTWLNQVYTSAKVPRIDVGSPISTPWGGPQMGGGRPGAPMGAMSANAIIDESALPAWLLPQDGPAAVPLADPMGGFGGPAFGMNGASAPAGANAGFANWGGQGALAGSSPDGGSVSAFSASDLIDPEALPAWVQNQQASGEAVFSSTMGWTSKQASPSGPGYAAADPGPMGGWGGQPQMPGPPAWGAGPAGAMPPSEANLPPWLQTADAPPFAGGAGFGTTQSGRRDPRGNIPDAELPPWLRNGPGGPGGPPARGPAPGAPPMMGAAAPWEMAPDSGQRQRGGQAPAWDGMAGVDEFTGVNSVVEQYADLFGDELPGGGGGFSYDQDHPPQADYDDAGYDAGYDEAPPDAYDDPPRKGKRSRWFGRR